MMLLPLRFALSNLSARPWRAALIIGAVTLSAALITAVSCSVGTVQASIESSIAQMLGRADARIIHQFAGRFSDDVLEEVRAWPEVAHAAGRLLGSLTAGGSDDEPIVNITAIGTEFYTDSLFRPVELLSGRPAVTPDEIVIDEVAAAELSVDAGDRITLRGAGGEREFTIAGVYSRPEFFAMVRTPQVRIDRRVLGELTGSPRELSNLLIILRPGEKVEPFTAQHAGDVARPLVLEPAEMARAGFDRRVLAGRFGMIVTSVLTFLGAAFIIVTAMTTSVIERQRDMAIARSIGAFRSQIFFSQLWLGLVVGGAGALVGVPLGMALTAILAWWYSDYLPAGLQLNALGVALSVIGSIGAGLLGAIYPAYLASSVSPLEAMSRRARPPRLIGIITCAAIGCALIAAQLSLMALSDESARFYTYTLVGLPALYVGYFLMSVPAIVLIARFIAALPLIDTLLHLPRGMLAGAVSAIPYRNGFTAGALMVGISILVSTWGGGQALLGDWVSHLRFGEGFAYSRAGITDEQRERIINLPFVRAASPVTFLPVRASDPTGRQIFGIRGLSPPNVLIIGFDAATFFEMNAAQWVDAVDGDQAEAIRRVRDGNAVLVAERFIIARNIGVGDSITLRPPAPPQTIEPVAASNFEIAGVIAAGAIDIAVQVFGVPSAYMDYAISAVFMDISAVQRHFYNATIYMIQLDIEQGVSDDDARAAIAAVAPGVRYRSGRWILERIDMAATGLLAVQGAVAFAALLIASIGMGNVLAANVHSRRHEYGVLRAAGANRGLLLRLILAEAAAIALVAAIVGSAIGMHLMWVAATFYRDLGGIELRMIVPYGPIAIGAAALLLFAILAALPAAATLMRSQPAALLAGGRAE